jgi:O-antigen ligase
MKDDVPISIAYARVLVGTLAWGVLTFGAVYAWAYVPLAGLAAALGLWGIFATDAWVDRRTRILAIMLSLIGLAVSLQLVALPYAWIQSISPGLDDYFRRFTLGYHPASLHPLSLVPEATVEVLLLYLALALFLVGLSRAIRYVKLDWLMTQLMGLGAALALIGVVQKALGNPDHPLVYGFWEPQQGGNPFGPFINRNHFAGWMVMLLPLVLAYAWAVLERARRQVDEPPPLLRWLVTVEANRVLLLAVVVLMMGMSIALTGSRSGVASLAIAMLVLAFFMIKRTQGGRRRLQVAAVLALVVVAAIGWAGVDRVADRFSRAPAELEGRFEAWRDTERIIRDFPAAGVGLGSYPQAMLIYQTSDRSRMYAEAHNDYLQLAAEGGLLVGLPVLLTIGTLAWTIRHRLRSQADDPMTYWVRVGAIAGIVGIAAQSVVEFSLQMPGNAAFLVLLIAIAIHRPSRRMHAHRV